MAVNILNVLPTYTAMSAEEIYRPFELYTTATRNAMNGYAQLDTQAQAIGQMLQAADQERDADLIQSYQTYMDNLSSVTDDLMNNGYSQKAEWALNKVQSQYAAMATPITTAYQARMKDIEAYQTAMAKDNTLMAAYDPSSSALSDYFSGAPRGNIYVSGKELREQAAKLGKAISNREVHVSQGFDQLMDDVYMILGKSTGYSNDQVMSYIASIVQQGYGDIPELNYAVNQILGNSQLASNAFSDSQRAAGLNQIIQGFIEGIVYDVDKPSYTRIGSVEDGRGDDSGAVGHYARLPLSATAVPITSRDKDIAKWTKLVDRLSVKDNDIIASSLEYLKTGRMARSDRKDLVEMAKAIGVDMEQKVTSADKLLSEIREKFNLYVSQSAQIGYEVPLSELGINAENFTTARFHEIKDGKERTKALAIDKTKLGKMQVVFNTATHRLEVVGDMDDDGKREVYTPTNLANSDYRHIADADMALADFSKPSSDNGWEKHDDGTYSKYIDGGNVIVVRSADQQTNALYIYDNVSMRYVYAGAATVADEINNSGGSRTQAIIQLMKKYYSQEDW